MNINKTLPETLKADIEYVLECVGNEQMYLYIQYGDESSLKQSRHSVLVTVGYIKDDKSMPVCIDCRVSEYKGHKFLQYEACSMYVDHHLILCWLEYHFPNIGKTDVSNFHLLMHRIGKQ